jgi:hypothetical protein
MIRVLVFLERKSITGTERIRFPSVCTTVYNVTGRPVPHVTMPLDVVQAGDVLAFEVLRDGKELNEWFELELDGYCPECHERSGQHEVSCSMKGGS